MTSRLRYLGLLSLPFLLAACRAPGTLHIEAAGEHARILPA